MTGKVGEVYPPPYTWLPVRLAHEYVWHVRGAVCADYIYVIDGRMVKVSIVAGPHVYDCSCQLHRWADNQGWVPFCHLHWREMRSAEFAKEGAGDRRASAQAEAFHSDRNHVLGWYIRIMEAVEEQVDPARAEVYQLSDAPSEEEGE